METNKVIIEKDILVFYVAASKFPEGVQDAISQLHSLFEFNPKRRIYGLSRPENKNGIIYKAAAEELYSGEAKELNCPVVIIPKGIYASLKVNDFRSNENAIFKAFQMLLKNPQLDPNSYCVECYSINNEEVLCMVKLEE